MSPEDQARRVDDKTYRITRRTRGSVWVRWEAYGPERRGLSRRLDRETFEAEFEELPKNRARKKSRKRH